MKNTRMIIAAVAVCALPVAAHAAVLGHHNLIAHRGESVDAPENTLPAYKTAVERGFGFECDIYLSKDGRVFTFHDRDLKRTSGGASTKLCSEATWDELSKIDVGSWGRWKDSRFAGTRPALLEEVLELARDGRKIYIEVKPGPEIVPYIKDVLEKQAKATPENVLFISFNSESCKALKRQMPQYKVYWLTSSRHKRVEGKPAVTVGEILSVLRETGADGVDCHFTPDVVTAEMISAVRKAGYEFHVWTIDRLDEAREAVRRGAQTVTTNCARKLADADAAEK